MIDISEDVTMKTAVAFLVASTFSICAFGAEPLDRPIGIEAENWIPVSDKLGFVIVATTEPAVPRIQQPNTLLLLNKVAPDAPAAGFFMIKSENGWRRLVVLSPADIAAAAKG